MFKELAGFMYGDPQAGRRFWYAHPLQEVHGLIESQLLWTPTPNALCMLWHVGHIAHRERTHIGLFLQSLPEPIVPAAFDVFGPEWCPAERILPSVGSLQNVFDWVCEVRGLSNEYIASLDEAGFQEVPWTAEAGLSVAHWLWITACHTALHVGRIQLLRALLEGQPERAC